MNTSTSDSVTFEMPPGLFLSLDNVQKLPYIDRECAYRCVSLPISGCRRDFYQSK